MSEGALVVLCTAPADGDAAERLARGLVTERLAACVNIIAGLRSFYRWEGAVQDDGEVQLVIKTTRARFAALEEWLAREHPYDTPEILPIDVAKVPSEGASRAYLDWLQAEAR